MKKLVLVLFLLFSSRLLSYDPNSFSRYGVYGQFNINVHSADFKKLPDCPSCSPGYQSGSGNGFTFGLLYEYPLSDLFKLGLRAEYFNYSAKLERNETITVISDAKQQNGSINHSINAKLSSVGIMPTVSLNLLSNINIFGGIHCGYVLNSHYDQVERIISPSNGTFIDSNGVDTHKKSRNELNGDIKNATAINLTGVLGINYEFPLNHRATLIAAPEFLYSINILPIVGNDLVNKWRTSAFRPGISLKYIPLPAKPEKLEEKIRIDTIKKESNEITNEYLALGKSESLDNIEETDEIRIIHRFITRTDTLVLPSVNFLSGDVTAYSVDEIGSNRPLNNIRVEEFRSSRLQPLLNYIFFDKSSDVIPDRYIRLEKSQAEKFNEDNFYKLSTLETYYEILNIIGSRMVRFPEAKLRLIGCNDGQSEADNKDLSLKRAESVAKYLEDTWGITPKRLQIETAIQSDNPSEQPSDSYKSEENRHVELYSDNYEILKPIYSSSTSTSSATDRIVFKTSANAKDEIETASLILRQSGQVINKSEYSSRLPEEIEIDLSKLGEYDPKHPGKLEYHLELSDRKRQFRSKTKDINIDLVTVTQKASEKSQDKKLDKYSLILFDFRRYDISGKNARVIDFIKEQIKPESKIIISGYTDITGNEEYNQTLSENRCKSVKEALKRPDAEIRGYGKSVLLYDNKLPEGRFYSRTVNVEVETPVK